MEAIKGEQDRQGRDERRVVCLSQWAEQRGCCSERQWTQAAGVARTTFQNWRHRAQKAQEQHPWGGLLNTPEGWLWVQHVVLAAHWIIGLMCGGGVDRVSEFLRLAGLQGVVGSSPTAQHRVQQWLLGAVCEWGDQQVSQLAQQMPLREIVLTSDEHFHEGQPCLIAMEPVSNYILCESLQSDRSEETWRATLSPCLDRVRVRVIEMVSDQAKALKKLSENLKATHRVDLFHVQQPLIRAMGPSLRREVKTARQDEQQAQARLAHWQQRDEQASTAATQRRVEQAEEAVDQARQEVERREELQESLIEQVRAVGELYHPFDLSTGERRQAERFIQDAEAVCEQGQKQTLRAGLSAKAHGAWIGFRDMIVAMAAHLTWFHTQVDLRFACLDLHPDLRSLLFTAMLPALYLQHVAPKQRNAETRKRVAQQAAQLLQTVQQHPLWLALTPEQAHALTQTLQRLCHLFQRSSSCVEGRNGFLALHHHGLRGVSSQKLQALTVLHNFYVRRTDLTTPAERFFGQRHASIFHDLIRFMPDLPAPRSRRKRAA